MASSYAYSPSISYSITPHLILNIFYFYLYVYLYFSLLLSFFRSNKSMMNFLLWSSSSKDWLLLVSNWFILYICSSKEEFSCDDFGKRQTFLHCVDVVYGKGSTTPLIPLVDKLGKEWLFTLYYLFILDLLVLRDFKNYELGSILLSLSLNFSIFLLITSPFKTFSFWNPSASRLFKNKWIF